MAKKEKREKLKRVTEISVETAKSIKGGKTCSCSCSCSEPNAPTDGEKSGTTLNTFAS
jgi:hypothetical protein